MKFDKLEYTGKKPYHDRHAATHWEPGDTKLVPEAVARKLLRFVEFRRAPVDQQQAEQLQPADQQGQQGQQAQQPDISDQQADDAALQQAHAAQQQAEQLQQQERAATEAMLLTIEGMDKGALAEYAAKYEVKLDARKGEAKMRAEVANLIEQFGAR